MKKDFPLTSKRHQPARVAEQIKGEIRKYLKRERSKTLPEGVDYWDFDCRAGESRAEAKEVHVKELGKSIDKAVEEGRESVYLEILVREGRRSQPGESS